VLLFVRSGETTPLFNHGRSSYGAATDAFKYCKLRFSSWYTTEKDPARAIPFKTFRCDVEAVVVLLFVRSGETTPLFNHGRSSYGASHRRFQALQASVQVAGILLKRILQEPYHSRPSL
jgi:hypothetical protein